MLTIKMIKLATFNGDKGFHTINCTEFDSDEPSVIEGSYSRLRTVRIGYVHLAELLLKSTNLTKNSSFAKTK